MLSNVFSLLVITDDNVGGIVTTIMPSDYLQTTVSRAADNPLHTKKLRPSGTEDFPMRHSLPRDPDAESGPDVLSMTAWKNYPRSHIKIIRKNPPLPAIIPFLFTNNYSTGYSYSA